MIWKMIWEMISGALSMWGAKHHSISSLSEKTPWTKGNFGEGILEREDF
jgi:hypothetical protein